MIVHKKSLGVLACVAVPGAKAWTEQRDLKLSMFPELDASEWWEVRDRSSLGRKILRSYPDFQPVEMDGKLVDIITIK